MPSDLKLNLQRIAKRKGPGHSLNSEIVSRLVESVEFSGRPLHQYSDGELIKELMDRYERGEVYVRIGRLDPADVDGT